MVLLLVVEEVCEVEVSLLDVVDLLEVVELLEAEVSLEVELLLAVDVAVTVTVFVVVVPTYDVLLLVVELGDVEVVVTVEVDVEVTVVELPAVTAVCACWLLPKTVRMYFCPKTMLWVGVVPCNSVRAPIVIGPS